MTYYLLHSIGRDKPTSNYNTLEEVLGCPEGAVLTFDGVYENVFRHWPEFRGRKAIYFAIGAHMGYDNRWDVGQPLEKFTTWGNFRAMCMWPGGEFGWHTWTHRDLTTVSDEQLRFELNAPEWMPRKHFAYPYGRFDERVIEAVKEAGWERAYTTNRGDDSDYQIRRRHI